MFVKTIYIIYNIYHENKYFILFFHENQLRIYQVSVTLCSLLLLSGEGDLSLSTGH